MDLEKYWEKEEKINPSNGDEHQEEMVNGVYCRGRSTESNKGSYSEGAWHFIAD